MMHNLVYFWIIVKDLIKKDCKCHGLSSRIRFPLALWAILFCFFVTWISWVPSSTGCHTESIGFTASLISASHSVNHPVLGLVKDSESSRFFFFFFSIRSREIIYLSSTYLKKTDEWGMKNSSLSSDELSLSLNVIFTISRHRWLTVIQGKAYFRIELQF